MESWHYAPWMCDGAADCTSLGLGLFTGSVRGCIPEILVGMVDAVTGAFVLWGCPNKAPLTGWHTFSHGSGGQRAKSMCQQAMLPPPPAGGTCLTASRH